MTDSIWVYALIPLFEAGDVKLPVEMELRVYPMRDLAFPDGIADDLEFLGADGKWHVFNDREREHEIRGLIARYDPDAHREIECRRIENAMGSEAA